MGYEDNFTPKFSKVEDNKVKISWEDFCIPTTADIADVNDDDVKLCTDEKECIIPLDSCTLYEFFFDVRNDLGDKLFALDSKYIIVTPPSESELDSAFSESQQNGDKFHWDLSHVFTELSECMAELNYSLKQDGNEVKKGIVIEDDEDEAQIEVSSENECGTTFELE